MTVPVAGVDVGGTNIEVGLVGDDHEVLDRAKASTPTTGPDGVLDTIEHLVRSLDGEPVAVGVGIPGVVHEGEVLDVERVVVGGGLAEKLGQHLADRIADAAQPWMLQPHPDLRFVAAALGDDSGVVGAAALGRKLVAVP